MKILNKEECEKALNNLADLSCIRSYSANEYYKTLSQVIKEHFELVDYLFTKEEITCIANCLAVACFDNKKAKAIMSKLEKQKELVNKNGDH